KKEKIKTMERGAGSPGTPSFLSKLNFADLRVSRSGGHRLRWLRLVLSLILGLVLRLTLYLRLLILLFRIAHLDATLQDRAFFNTDAMRDHITGEHAFAADVQPVCAIDVALHLAHDDNFFGRDVRRNVATAANGDAIFRETDRPFDASINEKRFPARHFTL